MRHKFPVLTVKKWLKSVYIYGSYRKNKTGVPFFWNTLCKLYDAHGAYSDSCFLEPDINALTYLLTYLLPSTR